MELGVYCISKHRADDHTFKNMEMDRPQSAGTKQPFVYLGKISLSRATTPSYRISSISTDINSSGRTRLSWKIAAQSVGEISGPFSEEAIRLFSFSISMVDCREWLIHVSKYW